MSDWNHGGYWLPNAGCPTQSVRVRLRAVRLFPWLIARNPRYSWKRAMSAASTRGAPGTLVPSLVASNCHQLACARNLGYVPRGCHRRFFGSFRLRSLRIHRLTMDSSPRWCNASRKIRSMRSPPGFFCSLSCTRSPRRISAPFVQAPGERARQQVGDREEATL
jgi:hypothetical protein